MAVAPTESYLWAQNLVANGPTGGNNRISVPTDKEDNGWLYGEKPTYEVMNGWQHSVSLWLAYMEATFSELDTDTSGLQAQIDTINNTTIPNIDGTDNNSFTIAKGSTTDVAKHIYIDTDEATPNESYLVHRPAPELESGGVTPLVWFGKDNTFDVTGYNDNEFPLNPRFWNIPNDDTIKALALEQIENYHAGAATFFVDVQYLGNTTAGSALATAETMISGEVEGDKLSVVWLEGVTVGLGNATQIVSELRVSNYTLTSGVWT